VAESGSGLGLLPATAASLSLALVIGDNIRK